jgi:hypothetical protein
MCILRLLILALVITSCSSDQMGLNSPLNKQLDSCIAEKVSSLNRKTIITNDSIQNISIDASLIDMEVKGFWTTINLFDACTTKSVKADNYFNNWTLKLNLDKQYFIKLTEISMKPEIIVAIKKNQLKLLEYILSEKQ